MTTALGDAFAYLTGDMTGFHGRSLRTGNALFTWAFGNNTAATLNDGKLFGDGVVLKADGGTSLFKSSYTNDLAVLMNATVGAEGAPNARVEQAGTGTLVLTQDNTATGIAHHYQRHGSAGQWRGHRLLGRADYRGRSSDREQGRRVPGPGTERR